MSIVRTNIHFNAFTHAALNTDGVLIETLTGVTEFTPRTPNVILDIVYDVAPANVEVLLTRRLEKRKVLGFSPQFDPAFNGAKRPNMPVGLAAGFFQVVEQQTAGAPAISAAVNFTLQSPLNV